MNGFPQADVDGAHVAAYIARMDYQAQKIRLLMQLRRNGVQDAAVLAAMETVAREAFVPEAFLDQAYEDRALPIDDEQTISQPTIVALMTQALELNERSFVLEVGTGSGYQAAVLAALCRRVHSIERHERLFNVANARFEQMKLRNITTHLGDGSKGWAHAAPYDRIIVTCAAFDDVPPALLAQLADDGVMVIPIETDGAQTLYRIHKEGVAFVKQPLCDVRFVPLVAA
jgi:protein-L-isoaspartate(D-aspartate) O-methyltransferase